MRVYSPAFIAQLAAAQDNGIAPVYFATFTARHRTTLAPVIFSFWTGDETITINVESESGGVVSRTFIGGVNLDVSGIVYVADLTDNAATVSLSQIAPEVQDMVRGHSVRFAGCTIHATTWAGGVLASTPEILLIGMTDAAAVGTPEADGDGSIQLSVRSELLNQLMTSNPAKSSDAHQRRRAGTDTFSKYAGVVGAWRIQWFKN